MFFSRREKHRQLHDSRLSLQSQTAVDCIAYCTSVDNLLSQSDKLYEVSPLKRRDDMPPAYGSWTVAKIAVGLRPSADGSAVRTSFVVCGG